MLATFKCLSRWYPANFRSRSTDAYSYFAPAALVGDRMPPLHALICESVFHCRAQHPPLHALPPNWFLRSARVNCRPQDWFFNCRLQDLQDLLCWQQIDLSCFVARELSALSGWGKAVEGVARNRFPPPGATAADLRDAL